MNTEQEENTMNTTRPRAPKSTAEILQVLGAGPRCTGEADRLIMQAVEALRKMRYDVDQLIEALSSEDGEIVLRTTHSHTYHAGYSGTLTARAAEATAAMAQVQGLISGVNR
jgi:hypothetical protein